MRSLSAFLLAAIPLAAQVQLVPLGDTSRLVAPGETVSLVVEVRNSEGASQPGHAVIFARPGNPAILERVSANDSGRAEYSFTAPETAGPLPVEALAERENVSTIFAVNVLGGEVPLVGAMQARGRLSEGPPVQGPYLLPAGASLRLEPGRPARVFDSPVWIAWRDGLPFQVFQHAAQIHLIDTADPEKPVETIEAVWWPSVRLAAGQPFVALRGWRESRVAQPVAESLLAPVAGSLSKAADGPITRYITNKEPNACAVIVYGTNEYWQTADESTAKNFFETQKGLAPENIFVNRDADGSPQPVTPQRFEELMAAALAKGCTRLYLVTIGHGLSGSITFTTPGPLTGDEEHDKSPYSYDALANQAKQFTNKGIPVTTIIKSCQSGSAIPSFHSAGVVGEIVTSSDASESSLYSWWSGSIFIREVFAGWSSDVADYDQSGSVELLDAFQYSLGDATNLAAKPQASNLGPLVTLAIPNVWIDLKRPETNPGFIVVTKPEYVRGDYEVVVSIEDSSIAAFADGNLSATVKVPRDQAQVRIPVTGLKEGVTTVRARIVDSQRKLWRGTAQVTVGAYEVSSSEVRLNTGETVSVPVRRAARVAGQPGSGNLIVVSPDANCLDVATVEHAQHAPSWIESSLQVYARRPGACKYTVFDPNRESFTLPVFVNGYDAKSPIIDGTSNSILFREAADLGERRVSISRTGSSQNTILNSFPDQVIYPPGSRELTFPIRCTGTGEESLLILDDRGNRNPARFVCPSAAAEARTFAATAPYSFFQAYDAMIIEAGWRNAAGGLLSYHATGVNWAFADGRVRFFDPNRVRTQDAIWSWVELARRDSPSGNFTAVDIPPNGSGVAYTNADGFVRVLFMAYKEGTYNLTFRSGSLPPVNYPIRVVARLAPPPDELTVLSLPATIRVGQEITLTTQVNRSQRPLQDAIVTLQSRNSNIRFLDGTVNTTGSLTQQRTGAPGRSIVRFRVMTAGPIDILVVSGTQVAEIKTTAAP